MGDGGPPRASTNFIKIGRRRFDVGRIMKKCMIPSQQYTTRVDEDLDLLFEKHKVQDVKKYKASKGRHGLTNSI